MGQKLLEKGLNKSLYLFLIFILFGSFVSDENNKRITWLKNNVKRIKTIEPYVNDFSDLEFLKEVIDTSSIVILGEMHHTDGSAKLAKSRIVRFLHEQMGFNVLVYEGDIYSYRKVNELIKPEMSNKEILQLIDDANTNSQISNHIDSSTFFLDLYLGRSINSKNPLKFAGIDMFSSNLRIKFLNEDLQDYMTTIDSTSSIRKLLLEYIRSAEKLGQFYHFNNNLEFKKFQNNTLFLVNLIESKTVKKKEDYFWLQILKTNLVSAKVWSSMKEPCEKEECFRSFVFRDKIMAENVQWLVNHEYPGEKIIIWTANYHATRKISKIKGLKSKPPDSTTMGNYLFEKFGNKMYSMVFVPYAGYTGNAGYSKNNSFMEIPRKNKESIENLIHNAGIAFGYLNFRNIPKGGEWLNEENKMYPTFWNETTAKWPEIYDGIFYIDEMKPDNILFIYPK